MAGKSPSTEESLDAVGDYAGTAHHIPPGEPDDEVAGDGQPPVSIPVFLEGPAGPVRGTAVRLHDQPGIPPEEIHHVVEQRDVYLRLGKAVLPANGEKPLLEVVAGGGGSDCVLPQKPSQSASAGLSSVRLRDRSQCTLATELKALCLVDHALELTRWEPAGEVKDRSRGGRDWNPILSGRLIDPQAGHSMGDQPGT